MTSAGREDGFTLVELLVVVLLLGVVGAVVISGLVNAMTHTREGQSRIYAMAELQNAAENVTRELRAACPVDAIDGDVGKEVSVVTVRAGERLRNTYRAVGTQLLHDQERRVNGAWEDAFTDRVVLPDLVDDDEPVFHYLDADGIHASEQDMEVVDDPWDVQVIRMTFRQVVPGQGSEITVRTSAGLRNGDTTCD